MCCLPNHLGDAIIAVADVVGMEVLSATVLSETGYILYFSFSGGGTVHYTYMQRKKPEVSKGRPFAAEAASYSHNFEKEANIKVCRKSACRAKQAKHLSAVLQLIRHMLQLHSSAAAGHECLCACASCLCLSVCLANPVLVASRHRQQDRFYLSSFRYVEPDCQLPIHVSVWCFVRS